MTYKVEFPPHLKKVLAILPLESLYLIKPVTVVMLVRKPTRGVKPTAERLTVLVLA
jgi:hypothetical protein